MTFSSRPAARRGFTLAVFLSSILFACEPASAQLEDRRVRSLVQFDLFEYQADEQANALRWDAFAWVGRDYDRLWLKSEGQQSVEGASAGITEVQALYARLVAPFWYLQTGWRFEALNGPGDDRSRSLGVLGVQGLAPYRFDSEAALFVSEDADVSARLTTTYDLLLTQQLVLQPRLDTNLAATSARRFGVGKGFNDLELGLRLRYEVRREFAPYVGVSWRRAFGDTADLAEEEGDEIERVSVVAGLRFWF